MLLVVNYHYLRPEFPAVGIRGETPAQFRDQLERLSKIGAFVEPWDLRNAALYPERHTIPERSILITFDDGLREQYDYAWPILEDMGIQPIFFVNTYPLLARRVLEVHQLHALLAVGWYPHQWGPTGRNHAEARAAYPYDEPSVAWLKYEVNVVMTPEQRRRLLGEAYRSVFDEPVESDALYVGWPEVKTLASRAYVGVHGHTHERREWQFLYAANVIAVRLDTGLPMAVSYPFGSRDACCVAAAEGFALGFTMERGVNADLSRPLLLGRISCADLPDEGPLDKLWELPPCVWS